MSYKTYLGNSVEILKSLPSSSVDSLVTDPPAGISLMNLDWDKDKGGRDEWIRWLAAIMRECFRVLKPGAFGFVWAIPRTSHWTAVALEDAGFVVKDVVSHVFGSGFPKSLAIDKALDRAKYTDSRVLFKVTDWIRNRRDELGLTNKEIDELAEVKGGACHWTARPPNGQPHIPTLERWQKLEPVLGAPPGWMKNLIKPANARGDSWLTREVTGIYEKDAGGMGGIPFSSVNREMTEPTQEESIKWKGFGTALKPASEHWILVQKPISEHNIASNIRKFGTGALNIDASRIPVVSKIPSTSNRDFRGGEFLWDNSSRSRSSVYTQHPRGRFPANFLLSRSENTDCPAKLLNLQADAGNDVSEYFKSFQLPDPFIYCKKPNKSEKGLTNNHPTVKPIKLMLYLIQMATPPGGCVLDPFMGSGSVGIAALQAKSNFIGIEQNSDYLEIANKRLEGEMNGRE